MDMPITPCYVSLCFLEFVQAESCDVKAFPSVSFSSKYPEIHHAVPSHSSLLLSTIPSGNNCNMLIDQDAIKSSSKSQEDKGKVSMHSFISQQIYGEPDTC